jgi:hypothetical protein
MEGTLPGEHYQERHDEKKIEYLECAPNGRSGLFAKALQIPGNKKGPTFR